MSLEKVNNLGQHRCVGEWAILCEAFLNESKFVQFSNSSYIQGYPNFNASECIKIQNLFSVFSI